MDWRDVVVTVAMVLIAAVLTWWMFSFENFPREIRVKRAKYPLWMWVVTTLGLRQAFVWEKDWFWEMPNGVVALMDDESSLYGYAVHFGTGGFKMFFAVFRQKVKFQFCKIGFRTLIATGRCHFLLWIPRFWRKAK